MRRNRLVHALLTVTLLFSLANHASASPIVPWTISGPGSTSATNPGTGQYLMTYDALGYGGAWDVIGYAPADGDYSFTWELTGLHSWFMAYAGLTASHNDTANSTLVNSSVWDQFAFQGDKTFTNVAAGDLLQFEITGRNWDYSMILEGTLKLTQNEVSEVPEPSTFLLLGAGLAAAALFVSRRKRTSSSDL